MPDGGCKAAPTARQNADDTKLSCDPLSRSARPIRPHTETCEVGDSPGPSPATPLPTADPAAATPSDETFSVGRCASSADDSAPAGRSQASADPFGVAPAEESAAALVPAPFTAAPAAPSR